MAIHEKVRLRFDDTYKNQGKRYAEALAILDDDGKVSIRYRDTDFYFPDTTQPFFRALKVIHARNESIRAALVEAGFPTINPGGKRVSFHATINEELYELVKKESEEKKINSSKLLNNILNERYGTHYN